MIRGYATATCFGHDLYRWLTAWIKVCKTWDLRDGESKAEDEENTAKSERVRMETGSVAGLTQLTSCNMVRRCRRVIAPFDQGD